MFADAVLLVVGGILVQICLVVHPETIGLSIEDESVSEKS